MDNFLVGSRFFLVVEGCGQIGGNVDKLWWKMGYFGAFILE